MIETYVPVPINSESTLSYNYNSSSFLNETSTSVASYVLSENPFIRYLKTDDREASALLQRFLSSPPPIGFVIGEAIKVPGLKARERAADLLGAFPLKTIFFARRFADSEFMLRPFYVGKIWSILLSALGAADRESASTVHSYLTTLLHSENASTRLAAYDALESLCDADDII